MRLAVDAVMSMIVLFEVIYVTQEGTSMERVPARGLGTDLQSGMMQGYWIVAWRYRDMWTESAYLSSCLALGVDYRYLVLCLVIVFRGGSKVGTLPRLASVIRVPNDSRWEVRCI